MLIQGFPAWNTQKQVTTDPPANGRAWAGIAIGPGSDEGLVYVDGFPLQGGRIHPVRSSRYTISHVRPLEADLPPIADVGRTGDLDTIAGLNIILFDEAAELGCEIARPNQNYNWSGPGPDTLHSVFTVPFVGRRQALFVIQSYDVAAASFGYRVNGVRYHYAARQVRRYPLHDAPAVTMSTNGTLAFYIGGTNDAEEWDCLELMMIANAVDDVFPTFNVDVDTIGEIGAR